MLAYRLKDVNLSGVSRKYEHTKDRMHFVNQRLEKTAFALYNWQTFLKSRNGVKRGHDGTARRALPVLFDVISQLNVIFIASAMVEDAKGNVNGHAIVWDGWRRILFIGAGASCGIEDRGIDGALVLNEQDCKDMHHVDPRYHVSISQHVLDKFGIRIISRTISNAHALTW